MARALRFTFNVEGETQVDRTLARFADGVDDARPVWEKMARSFAAINRRQFASEGATGSGGWAALSPAYGAWKAHNYPGKPILELTGALKDSLTRRPFGVEVIEPGYMVLGSGIEYGKYHQQGTDRMPQRRPVELTESKRREWVNWLQRFIVTGRV